MSVTSGGIVVTATRRRLRLGKLLKSGGAGSVYPVVDAPDEVAKIYHDGADRAGYERKVAAMLDLSPNLPDLVDGGRRYVQIAWPQVLLRDERGGFAGFAMPMIDVQATSELECILQERQARAEGLPTGLGAKVTLAANLSAVIAELHRQGHCVIDLKPVNVRFYRRTLYMAMLDCDGFSIQGRGERFAAQLITPDYLAPEFQNQPIPQACEEQQDRFALAVVIFQLLNFGIHPFTGRPQDDRVPTDIPGRIAHRCYAYGLHAHAALLPSPVSGHASMPAELRALFDRAFEGTGSARPAAQEWASALKGYAQRSQRRLVACVSDPQHQHFAGLPCATCARAALISDTARMSRGMRAEPKRPPTQRLPARTGPFGLRVLPTTRTATRRAQPSQLPPNAAALLAALAKRPSSGRTLWKSMGGSRWVAALLVVYAVLLLSSELDHFNAQSIRRTPTTLSVESSPAAAPLSTSSRSPMPQAPPVPPPSGPPSAVSREAGVDNSFNSMHPPEYPREALANGITGTVVLLVTVNADGKPVNVTVETSSHDRTLDRAAVEAAEKWKFNPRTKNGKRVEGVVRVPVSFNL